ncbi:MAG: FAD-dependent oxidoreductase [Clostridiales bacterium]|nr:FAD-dependent oxidoreductase [Clostridiales bacterium]
MAYYIEKGCVGCHYCKLECPAEAIRIKDGRYQIDSSKCTECGSCVELCHLDLIRCTDDQPKTSRHEPVVLNCDVLVMGAGGVGTGAAARASYLGLDVILIEAAKHYGGGTYLAHGAFFPGSVTLSARLGFDPGLERTVNFWAGMQKGAIDKETLRGNISVNGEFIDWFDSLDPSFTAGFVYKGPHHPTQMDMPERHINKKSNDDSIGPGWMGSWVTEKLFEAAVRNGVRYFNKTRAMEFITDENGKITGVIARDEGGIVQINAKAFVLGTGGYMMNDERMKAIDPDLIRENASYLRINVPTNIGDGHDMVSKIGGIVDYGRGGSRGPTHHPYSYCVNRMMGQPEMVFFSDEGDRLFELSTMGHHPGPQVNGPDGKPSELILRSKTGKCYMILDSELLEKAGNSLPMLDNGRMPDWRSEVAEEVALDDLPAKKADTIEELAVKLGIEPARLTVAVERYNGMCRKGVDEDFGKDPKHMMPIVKAPYYAFLAQNFDNGASRGGITIDHNFNVVYKNGQPIEGLYCAGDCATTGWTENVGPVGLCGGLGGSWASGYQIANLIKKSINV